MESLRGMFAIASGPGAIVSPTLFWTALINSSSVTGGTSWAFSSVVTVLIVESAVCRGNKVFTILSRNSGFDGIPKLLLRSLAMTSLYGRPQVSWSISWHSDFTDCILIYLMALPRFLQASANWSLRSAKDARHLALWAHLLDRQILRSVAIVIILPIAWSRKASGISTSIKINSRFVRTLSLIETGNHITFKFCRSKSRIAAVPPTASFLQLNVWSNPHYLKAFFYKKMFACTDIVATLVCFLTNVVFYEKMNIT